ncbi:hypothetical protein ACNJYA_09040 [Bradyrhizobium sp. DASA03068]|uniref:hypothetical protein n=1 Tax=Bradyrhizobium sp. BLXBL-01 TaxID=3395915 RepID=UPI003F703912
METIENNLLSVLENEPIIAMGHAMHREPELPSNGWTRQRILEFWTDPVWSLNVDLRSIGRPACTDDRVDNSMPETIVNVVQLGGLRHRIAPWPGFKLYRARQRKRQAQ